MNDIRDERLQVMLSPEELAAVDDFRFKHRMPTRAAAVRELLRLGLASIGVNGGAMGWGFSILSFFFIMFVVALELLMCIIQAYVFALLTTLYLNDAIHMH